MSYFDKSLKEFSNELQNRKMTNHTIAEIFYKIETHGNPRESYWQLDNYEQHLKSDDRVFYIEKNGEFTAFIFYKWIEPEIEITHWAVKYKGCGEGGAAFSLFLSKIAARAYKVTLECGEWNQIALRLYEAYQFERVSFRPKYYRTGEGAWILQRSHNS